MQLAVITGSSRGLGFEFARLCLESGIAVLGISRHASSALNHKLFTPLDLDLSNLEIDAFEDSLSNWQKQYPKWTSSWLFHSAATVDPLGSVGEISSKEIDRCIQFGVTATAQLLNSFVRLTQNAEAAKVAALVSSGAAESTIRGAAIYCASKAAMEMYAQVVDEEQKTQRHPVEISIIRPGIFESSMQEQLRASSILDKEIFLQFKEQKRLKTAADVAGRIFMKLKKDGRLPKLLHL